jgi:PDZ domain
MKHGLISFLLLISWTASFSSRADETPASPETSQYKSDASTSSNASTSVVAGPLATERVALLMAIRDAEKKGVGIRDYMTAFQNLEVMVNQGAQPDTIRQRLRSIEQPLQDQLSHLAEITHPGIPPETGIVGFKYKKTNQQSPEIETVFPGTAADKSHLARGDVILEVGGVSTKDLTKDEIYEKLVGSPGTSVRLKLSRGNVVFVRTLQRTRLQDLGKVHPDVLKLYSAPSRD